MWGKILKFAIEVLVAFATAFGVASCTTALM